MTYWDYIAAQDMHRETPANLEPCSVCGDEEYWWLLREDGLCPLCDIGRSMPDPPRPPPLAPLAEVIDINTRRNEK